MANDKKYQIYKLKADVKNAWEDPEDDDIKHIFVKPSTSSYSKTIWISKKDEQNGFIAKSLTDAQGQIIKSSFDFRSSRSLNDRKTDVINAVNNSDFSSKFNNFFQNNSFTNPNPDNNAFSYMRANWINKEPYYIDR